MDSFMPDLKQVWDGDYCMIPMGGAPCIGNSIPPSLRAGVEKGRGDYCMIPMGGSLHRKFNPSIASRWC